jgi:hypothetical protein
MKIKLNIRSRQHATESALLYRVMPLPFAAKNKAF